MNPIEEKFQSQNLVAWIEQRLKANRDRKKKLGQEIKEEDYERLPFVDFLKLYGMIAGCREDEARYYIECLVRLVQYLLRNEYTTSIGPKTGTCLGELFFSEYEESKKTIRQQNGNVIDLELPARRIPRLKISNQMRKLVSLAYCPYCEGENNTVLLSEYERHVREFHGVQTKKTKFDF